MCMCMFVCACVCVCVCVCMQVSILHLPKNRKRLPARLLSDPAFQAILARGRLCVCVCVCVLLLLNDEGAEAILPRGRLQSSLPTSVHCSSYLSLYRSLRPGILVASTAGCTVLFLPRYDLPYARILVASGCTVLFLPLYIALVTSLYRSSLCIAHYRTPDLIISTSLAYKASIYS